MLLHIHKNSGNLYADSLQVQFVRFDYDVELSVKAIYAESLSPGARKRVIVKGYIEDVYTYSGAANVVVTRAGATNLAEFSVQGKACIVVPSPFLTGGHQLKNAQFLQDSGAAIVVNEIDVQADPNFLARAISDLLKDPVRSSDMVKNYTKRPIQMLLKSWP